MVLNGFKSQIDSQTVLDQASDSTVTGAVPVCGGEAEAKFLARNKKMCLQVAGADGHLNELEPQLLRIKMKQLMWFGHFTRMPMTAYC